MSATYAMYPEYPEHPQHRQHPQHPEHPHYRDLQEWGPARHDPDHPSSRQRLTAALQAALDLRDNGGQQPDDN